MLTEEASQKLQVGIEKSAQTSYFLTLRYISLEKQLEIKFLIGIRSYSTIIILSTKAFDI